MAVLVVRSLQRDGAWTLDNYTDLGSTGGRSALLVTVWEAAANSVSVAVAAAAIALTLGVAVCLVVSRRPRSRALARIITGLDAAFMLPLGVSAVTVGFGFLITLARPPLALTRSWWILPLAQAVVAVPLVMRTLLPALCAIDPRQREAAAALGAGPGRVLATVDGPQLLRAGGVLGFLASSFIADLSSTWVAVPVLLIVTLLGVFFVIGKPLRVILAGIRTAFSSLVERPEEPQEKLELGVDVPYDTPLITEDDEPSHDDSVYNYEADEDYPLESGTGLDDPTPQVHAPTAPGLEEKPDLPPPVPTQVAVPRCQASSWAVRRTTAVVRTRPGTGASTEAAPGMSVSMEGSAAARSISNPRASRRGYSPE